MHNVYILLIIQVYPTVYHIRRVEKQSGLTQNEMWEIVLNIKLKSEVYPSEKQEIFLKIPLVRC